MKLHLSPQMRDDYPIIVEGDVIYLGGYELDFGPLPEGAYLPPEAIDCELIVGGVWRRNGQIELTVIVPCCPSSPDSRTMNTGPIDVLEDGVVDLPPYSTVEVPDEPIEVEIPV